MIIFVGVLLVICLFRAGVLLSRNFDSVNYISRARTQAINGIFVFIILMNHTLGFVDGLQGPLDAWYEPFKVFLGQFVVVTFFFYSGYGIMESILHKENYIRSFPKKRLLPLWLRFVAITAVYTVLNLILQTEETLFTHIFSYIGLTTIGNGGWFMFTTFTLYGIVILSFLFCRKKPLAGAILTTALTSAVVIVEFLLDFPSYYFSTMIFFPAGMLFSFLQKPFLRIVTANHIVWGLCTAVSFAGFIVLKSLTSVSVVFYPVWCGFGLLAILLLTLKVRIGNPILVWLGQNAFSIFMLQGIPQLVISYLHLPVNLLSYILVFASTVLLTLLYNLILSHLPGVLGRLRSRARHDRRTAG